MDPGVPDNLNKYISNQQWSTVHVRECLPSDSFYFQVLEPQMSPTSVAESVNDNTLSTTTITESECFPTVPTYSSSSVSNVDTHTVTNRELPVTNEDTDQRFVYRLQNSLDDMPLVNITDSVIHRAKNSTSVSTVDVGTADIYSINVNLQKSILIPLKIQVIVRECYTGHVPILVL
jgi:hypothetical protein